MSYPEHEKLNKVKDTSQSIGEFLEWMKGTKHFWICQVVDVEPEDDEDYAGQDRREEFAPAYEGTEKLLAEYFNIDLKKLEAEKEQMLDDFRKRNEEDAKNKDHTSMLMFGMDYRELPDAHKQQVRERMEQEAKK